MTFEFGNDPEVQAAWLYYGEGRTQAETADMLGVSRATVANFLSAARKNNLVTISLAPDLLSRVNAASALREKFSLENAYVAPVQENANGLEVRRALACAAAHLVDSRIEHVDVLGVAAGRTMAALGEEIPHRDHPGLSVVQVSGSSLGDEATSPEACTLLLASRLGAHGFNFHAPAVVTSRTLRDALLDEPTLIRHFERIRSCAIVIFSVGGLTAETTWAQNDQMMKPVLPEYIKRGASGVIIGRFIDPEGREIAGSLSGRQVGLRLADLLAIPERICVAGGLEKTAAIHATLMGGYATHLVTDANTATRLLEQSA